MFANLNISPGIVHIENLNKIDEENYNYDMLFITFENDEYALHLIFNRKKEFELMVARNFNWATPIFHRKTQQYNDLYKHLRASINCIRVLTGMPPLNTYKLNIKNKLPYLLK